MMEKESAGSVFTYSTKDYVHDVPSIKNGTTLPLTKFDRTLQSQWDEAMEKGMFKYVLNKCETKILPGKKSYVVQRNVLRGTARRTPQNIASINQLFNPDLFNFNKIKDGEVLMELRKEDQSRQNSQNGELEQESRNLVIINASPLEYGHVLLVPATEECHPQRLDYGSIKLGVEMLLLSSHPGFRLGFNGLCALASVNHRHIHAYYTEYELYAEYVNARKFHEGVDIYELDGMSCRGFGFQLCDSDVDTMSQQVAKCVDHFQRSEVAYNLFFTRGVKFGADKTSSERTVRLLLYPRQHYLGVKELLMFNTAVVELSGHIVCIVSEGYDSANEEDIDAQIASVSLSEEEFGNLKAQLVKTLDSS